MTQLVQLSCPLCPLNLRYTVTVYRNCGYGTVYKASSFLMTAEVNSEVVAEPRWSAFSWVCTDNTDVVYLPPISAVRTTPLLMTSKVAEAMLFARLSRLERRR